MDYENLPGPSRSADDIEAYAKIARQREKEETQARREAEREERRAQADAARAEADARREAKAKQKAERDAEREATAEADAEQEAKTKLRANALVRTLYFVAKLDRYLARVESDWVYIKLEALRKQYAEFMDDRFYPAFIRAMAANDRNFLTCTYSAKNQQELGPDTLNLLDRDEWVQPVEGQHHWLFDVLMQSLGGDKAENIRHLEHVIYCHRMHPEYYLLPCIVMHGEGGTGKNLLVDKVLYTMFPRQTVSATSDNVIGNFNGLLVGMMAALVNENMAERGNMNTLKDLLHKPRLTVNIKNVPQFVAENKDNLHIDNTQTYMAGDEIHGVPMEASLASHERSLTQASM